MSGTIGKGKKLGRWWSVAVAVVALVTTAAGSAGENDGRWPQFGGPNQDFHAPAGDLAERWPEGGPPKLWQRQLGDGYSSILYAEGRLYTMYRRGEEEVVVCLDASDGETVWEYAYRSSPPEGHVAEFGRGPRSTPLLVGDRLFAVGVAGRMHALDRKNGELLWAHDLWGEEFGGNFLLHGYASSPVAYRDTVIVLVGGEGASVVAFRQADGTVAWKAQSFENSYCTPQILEVAGEEQLVTFMAAEVIGVDPADGELRWSYPFENQFAQNITLPTLVEGRYLFLSAYQVGARGLELTRNERGEMEVAEIWSTRKIQYYHVTTVLDGEWIYGSTGLRAPAFMSAVNAKTGEIAWRSRGFAKANTVYADGKLIILDENGKLALATATPEGLTVHSEVELLERVSWTPPTIVGETLYVRDKTHLMALDLGRKGGS
jgi:outer membrane protein assembly factor BamB